MGPFLLGIRASTSTLATLLRRVLAAHVVNGVEAPPPVSAGWTFCDTDADRAREQARRWIGGYYQTVLDHYQFQGDHLARTRG